MHDAGMNGIRSILMMDDGDGDSNYGDCPTWYVVVMVNDYGCDGDGDGPIVITITAVVMM